MIDLFNFSKILVFCIVIVGKDVMQILDKCLLSMMLIDNCGFEVDQFDLELDDVDGLVIMLCWGVVIFLVLGWKGELLFLKGKFIVDEIEYSGSLD